MVVYDIENDSDPVLVCGFDQLFQAVRTAVVGFDGKIWEGL